MLSGQNLAKLNKFQTKTMFITGDTVGLAGWIIDGIHVSLLTLVTIFNLMTDQIEAENYQLLATLLMKGFSQSKLAIRVRIFRIRNGNTKLKTNTYEICSLALMKIDI